MEKVFSNGKMEVNIQESIKKVKNMVMENIKKLMEMFLKDFLKMMYFKAKELIYIKMEIHMSVYIKMDTEEEKEYLLGLMGINMMENGEEV